MPPEARNNHYWNHRERHPEVNELVQALEAAAAADAKAESIAAKMSGADSGTVRALMYSLDAAEKELREARVRVFDLNHAESKLPPEIIELDTEYKKYAAMADVAARTGDQEGESAASAQRDEAKLRLDGKKASIVALS